MEIIPIKAFKDNYIWCIVDSDTKQCVVVDPGDAKPVFEYLNNHDLILKAILITHHHWDHTNGVAELMSKYHVAVYGAENSPNELITQRVNDNDEITILNKFKLRVLTIPGHTLDHIAYYGDNKVFSGDTLFGAGCGRIFEGSAEQMYGSLNKLKNLPENTEVYCGHEYTVANLQFAKVVEPNNKDILSRLEISQALVANNDPTLPSTIALEKCTNPFFRSDQHNVIAAVSRHAGQALLNPVDVFRQTRLWKDGFRS